MVIELKGREPPSDWDRKGDHEREREREGDRGGMRRVPTRDREMQTTQMRFTRHSNIDRQTQTHTLWHPPFAHSLFLTSVHIHLHTHTYTHSPAAYWSAQTWWLCILHSWEKLESSVCFTNAQIHTHKDTDTSPYSYMDAHTHTITHTRWVGLCLNSSAITHVCGITKCNL